MEVEFTSDRDHDELPGELFDAMFHLANEEATEQALLGGLQDAVITYLNLHAPELVSRDEHLEMRLEIIAYGGG